MAAARTQHGRRCIRARPARMRGAMLRALLRAQPLWRPRCPPSGLRGTARTAPGPPCGTVRPARTAPGPPRPAHTAPGQRCGPARPLCTAPGPPPATHYRLVYTCKVGVDGGLLVVAVFFFKLAKVNSEWTSLLEVSSPSAVLGKDVLRGLVGISEGGGGTASVEPPP